MTQCKCFSHNGFLTKEGYSLVDQLHGDRARSLAQVGLLKYLDSMGSVSALDEDEDPHAVTRWNTCLEEAPHAEV